MATGDGTTRSDFSIGRCDPIGSFQYIRYNLALTIVPDEQARIMGNLTSKRGLTLHGPE
jgi:hypothetical protein